MILAVSGNVQAAHFAHLIGELALAALLSLGATVREHQSTKGRNIFILINEESAMLLHVSLPLLQLLGMDMYSLGTCAGEHRCPWRGVLHTQGRLSLQLSVADAQINDF